jgi:DNA-binding response OmpR family regulator
MGPMACLVCAQHSEVGSLCRECAQQVPVDDHLIPEHIRSSVPSMDADAWLVDGFGAAHGVAARTMLGRSHEDMYIAVLSASVSREHAEIRRTDEGWQLRDVGSRNGTFVNGVRVQNRAALPARAVIKFGDIAMWFLVEVADDPTSVSLATRTRMDGLVRFAFATTSTDNAGEREFRVVGTNDLSTGGTLMWRPKGTEKWQQTELPKLEFHLLRLLCQCAYQEADSPVTARGCVQTKELARELPFTSKYANEENVRQVVRRLRGQLAEVGAPGTLDVVPGRGYYITCPVTLGAG